MVIIRKIWIKKPRLNGVQKLVKLISETSKMSFICTHYLLVKLSFHIYYNSLHFLEMFSFIKNFAVVDLLLSKSGRLILLLPTFQIQNDKNNTLKPPSLTIKPSSNQITQMPTHSYKLIRKNKKCCHFDRRNRWMKTEMNFVFSAKVSCKE